MRLWSLHPKYLDSKGLVALWREGLLAQAVLRGQTRGYRHHPQLTRFKQHPQPLAAISSYLNAVYCEAKGRGYSFDRSKIRVVNRKLVIPVSNGQMRHEWSHLLRKLKQRSPHIWRCCSRIGRPRAHPLFAVRPGPVEPWEIHA
jgi:pyrimidine dimer DNA glycosylase